MSTFNEKINEISLKEVLFVIVISYVLIFSLNFLNIVHMDINIINLIIIIFFAVKLKNFIPELKLDISNVFSIFSFKDILIIVLINICFSYGMLYFSKWIIQIIPPDYISFFITKSIANGLIGIIPVVSIILVSPIVEELVFRGVFLKKINLIVPTTFAILFSSLLFASLHAFGSIFSAFVFAVCMALLYLKTDNIVVPIFAHFLNNLIGEAIYHLDSSELLFKNDAVVGLMSILAVISFILILRFINSNLKNI